MKACSVSSLTTTSHALISHTHSLSFTHSHTYITHICSACIFYDGGNKRGEKSDRSIGLERLLEEATL